MSRRCCGASTGSRRAGARLPDAVPDPFADRRAGARFAAAVARERPPVDFDLPDLPRVLRFVAMRAPPPEPEDHPSATSWSRCHGFAVRERIPATLAGVVSWSMLRIARRAPRSVAEDDGHHEGGTPRAVPHRALDRFLQQARQFEVVDPGTAGILHRRLGRPTSVLEDTTLVLDESS